MKLKLKKEFLDTMSRDTGYWRGPFYFNRRDPRLLVPKLHPSMGWTLNFANPAAWFAVAAILGMVVVISVFSI